MKRHARNLRDIRHAIHGPSGDIGILSGEYADIASRRVVVYKGNFAVAELPVEDEQDADKYERFRY